MRRVLILFFTAALISCSGKKIDYEDYKELQAMERSLGFASSQISYMAGRNLHELNDIYTKMGLDPEPIKDFIEIENILIEMKAFREYIEELEDNLIVNSGGYDDRDNLINWNKKISPDEHLSWSDEYTPQIDFSYFLEKRPVIISLVALRNLENTYLNLLYDSLLVHKSHILKRRSNQMDIKSVFVLTRTLSTPAFEINSPGLRKFNAFPVDKFIIDDRIVTPDSNHCISLSMQEWNNAWHKTVLVQVPDYNTPLEFTLK